MSKTFLRRINELDKKIKSKFNIEVIRFLKPNKEKFIIDQSTLKYEVGTLVALSELNEYENSISFIENITE